LKYFVPSLIKFEFECVDEIAIKNNEILALDSSYANQRFGSTPTRSQRLCRIWILHQLM